jgi:hypothetical protein
MKLRKEWITRDRIDLSETPPEMRNVIRSAQERIGAATEMFETNFHEDGKPKTKEGKILTKKYEQISDRAPRFLVWRIKLRYWIKSVFKKSNRE